MHFLTTPLPWLLIWVEYFLSCWNGRAMGPTQGLHPLGAAIATLPSKRKAQRDRPADLRAPGHSSRCLPPPLSPPRVTRGHQLVTLESQVLVPTLQSMSS